MTIDEAIKIIYEDVRIDLTRSTCGDVKRFNKAFLMAIKALEEKKERESNQPLTINELSYYRKNNLPVFIKTINIKNEPCGWALAGTRGAISQDIVDCALWYDTYGIDWIAYKYKPNELNGEGTNEAL